MKKQFDIIGFLIGWVSVITQFILMLQNRQAGIVETIIRFFSFFTILTNTLVALYFTARAFKIKNEVFSIFYKKGTLTALTVFILVVGMVYQIILRHVWEPKGLQLIIDEMLHTINPIFVLVYWILFALREDVNFQNIKSWLWYPVIYFAYIIIRGYFSGFYPYPFVNIPVIGYKQLFINFILICSFIIALSAILVAIGRKLKRNSVQP